MTIMEKKLKKMDKKLYSLYQRSFSIATLEWLPNVVPNLDSYNSLPHIMGIMRQVDRLLYEDDGCHITLNKSELYVLLCSILLHDIGKCAALQPQKTDNIQKKPDHAEASEKTIMSHWAELGLASERVARVIGDVCRFHDGLNISTRNDLCSEYYIDQFEKIRGRLLGALLFLADHLDNSMSRVVPEYLHGDAVIEVIGKFRRKIVDVRPDKSNRMIRIILSRENFVVDDLYGEEQLEGALQDYIKQGKGKYNGSFPKESVLHAIAKNTLQNDEEIAFIKDELNIMDIPMKKWLIECEQHLFEVLEQKNGGKTNLTTVYALEPLINLDYCIEILRGVCELSGGIFGQPFHKYIELVNYIREEKEKTYKVKCAVKRLSLLLKADKDSNPKYSIYYDDNVWKFECSDLEDMKDNKQDIKEKVFSELVDCIKKKLQPV